MTFENPGALWLSLTVPCLLFGLGLWGWLVRKDIALTLRLDVPRLRGRQLEKYALAAALAALLTGAMASPVVPRFSPADRGRAGEIALLVDVSASMAARQDVGSPSRMERATPILLEIVDRMAQLKDVRVSLHGFTTIARSHTPSVAEEDYPYVRESIKRVLDVYSVPGPGTSLGRPVLQVLDKFSEESSAKLVILVSDGEPFIGLSRGMHQLERDWIEEAIAKAKETSIRVVAVGVGEPDGAKIPIADEAGRFTHEFARLQGAEYVSYLDETLLMEIASRTGGKYFGEKERDELLIFIEDNLSPTDMEGAVEQVEERIYLGHWLVLGALPIWLVLAKRHLLS